MIHMIQINSLLVWIYLYTYICIIWIWLNSSGHESHPSQYSSLVNWFDSTSFWNWFDSAHDSISFFNESIHLVIQAVMKHGIRFDSWFKQKSFDSDSIHDSNKNRLHVLLAHSSFGISSAPRVPIKKWYRKRCSQGLPTTSAVKFYFRLIGHE